MKVIILSICIIMGLYFIITAINKAVDRSNNNCFSLSYRFRLYNKVWNDFLRNVEHFKYIPNESTEYYKVFYWYDKFNRPRYEAFLNIPNGNCSILVANDENNTTDDVIYSVVLPSWGEGANKMFNALIDKIN